MFSSVGTVIYSENPQKIILSIDDEIGRFYRSCIPLYHRVQKPLYPSHISILRNEIPINLCYWNKYQRKEISFEYDSFIYNDEIYYWLSAYSQFLEQIRIELGLPNISQFTKSPDGKHKFHITIANKKHLL